jgi:hypothetical protein
MASHIRFHLMKSKEREAVDLAAELMRLNSMVRARRKQLARLDKCPNKDCECRVVWRDVVEKNLAGQVGKIRKQVKPPAKKKTAKSGAKPTKIS